MEELKRILKPHQIVAPLLYIATVFTAFTFATIGNPPNTYFSNKRNLFNVFFVKIGWFWVTLIYFIYLYAVRSKRLSQPQAFVQGSLRYVIVTVYWYLMTQWFLGPSFIDRVFVLTGGGCRSLLQDVQMSAQLASVFQQTSCRRMGGLWQGGHDVSGHCVLLIHASMFFWEELSWVYYTPKKFMELKLRDQLQWVATGLVMLLSLLWIFMLFMTGVYFHGHFEVLSGTIFGLLGWAVLVS
jgi:hypothetical protein